MKALGRRKLWSHVATKEKYGLLYDAFKSRDYLFGLVQYFLLGVMLSAIDIFLLSEHGRMISSFVAGWKLDTGAPTGPTFEPVSEWSCQCHNSLRPLC